MDDTNNKAGKEASPLVPTSPNQTSKQVPPLTSPLKEEEGIKENLKTNVTVDVSQSSEPSKDCAPNQKTFQKVSQNLHLSKWAFNFSKHANEGMK